ncbi:uncharacterized protein J4E78_005377 [Alternaria triticimaculans]|uniref:uncharacterized protein n=1 Tax=Alternaria triticimaculans TaxID=297637 RepID=UPI0020C3E705|nr:uncharacterized protein J4E78_005377 [Alternaria triticimaculans]KAI4660672.1 hypothetical protein J4E78_005377 [Alternaria triticimaculans]
MRTKSQVEQQACRRLAIGMYSKLPRELRDIVYGYAIKEPFLIRVPDFQQLKNAEVPSTKRIYSQFYVGVEVAREVAEYYYSKQYIIAKFQTLRETLTQDVFHLGVKPYMHTRELHVLINNDKISGCLVKEAGADANGRLIENVYVENCIAQEKGNLDDLYQKLEAGFALFKGEREPSLLKLRIIIKMSGYSHAYYEHTQEGVTAMRDYERRFMNMLETIRKPVYDMIHAGCNVEVKFEKEMISAVDRYWGDGTDSGIESDSDEETDIYMRLNLTPALFHLSKEEWEKEKATNVYIHGRYNPKSHYKSHILLRYTRINKHYQMDFARNLAEYRARWGYTSFEKLLHVGKYIYGPEDGSDGKSEDSGGYSMPWHRNSSAYSDSERPDGWTHWSEEDEDYEDGDVGRHSDDSLDEWAMAQIA